MIAFKVRRREPNAAWPERDHSLEMRNFGHHHENCHLSSIVHLLGACAIHLGHQNHHARVPPISLLCEI
jgi:hypothetical protein